MAEQPRPFSGVQNLLFNAPLYERFLLEEGYDGENALFRSRFTIDGHCPFCGRLSTFSPVAGLMTEEIWTAYLLSTKKSFKTDLIIECARSPGHRITFHLKVCDRILQKSGQDPSFADIALDESKTYRSVLSRDDAAELHKAIGLAAHGVGIGAFVYIRRIFERLIRQRFDEFKAQEGWSDDDFEKRRIVERIELLENHLPPFLVQNSKLYGILSRGIHELDEQQCLSIFEVIRASTVIILDEDKKKKEERTLRENLERAIASYTPKQTDGTN